MRQMVDSCSKCRGIFFDNRELNSILALVEKYRQVELAKFDKEIETLPMVTREFYLCPEDGTAMERKDYGGDAVDVCGECKGIWLDDGELFSLKSTEEHINRYLTLYKRLGD